MFDFFYLVFLSPIITAASLTTILAVLAFSSYSRTGPKIKNTIEKYFRTYAIFAFFRTLIWSFIVICIISAPGPLILYAVSVFSNWYTLTWTNTFFASLASFTITASFALSHNLLYIPAAVQLSSQFRFSRLIPLWQHLTPIRLSYFRTTLIGFLSSTVFSISYWALSNHFIPIAFYSIALFFFYLALLPVHKVSTTKKLVLSQAVNGKNIILIGVDTLRADKLGANASHHKLTPNIDKLCAQGVLFENCITPLARTAPSLTSFLTGLWPHNHFIRDNYPDKAASKLNCKNLIELLNNNNYATAAISDWAGADYKKINFGFQKLSVPDDQWNIKLLLRQGPAYLRLFLSLFTHNRFGKYFIPEIYYLAGKPLTSHLGIECRNTISELAKKNQPFLVNLFTSTTHAPFGSEYPYYNMFTPKDYSGESRFIMTDLYTPEQIIESQESTLAQHDLNQIINLYDSCVKEFDDEVGKIIDHIDKCGLRDNTFIVIYSDHGTDFFETECWGQGNTLIGNDPSARIPLIISGPGVPENVKFNHVCRSIDFMPTMLDLLGMEIPKDLDGVSLVPYLKDNLNPNLYAYQETGVWMGKIPGQHPDQITYPDIIELLTIRDFESGTLVIDEKYYSLVIKSKNRSIQNNRWKLIYIPTHHGPVYQLYDIINAPYRDVVNEYPEVFYFLKAKLDDWISHSF